jgi:hypothetical protein
VLFLEWERYMKSYSRRLKQGISAILAATVILLSPGLGAYAAFAAVVAPAISGETVAGMGPAGLNSGAVSIQSGISGNAFLLPLSPVAFSQPAIFQPAMVEAPLPVVPQSAVFVSPAQSGAVDKFQDSASEPLTTAGKVSGKGASFQAASIRARSDQLQGSSGSSANLENQWSAGATWADGSKADGLIHGYNPVSMDNWGKPSPSVLSSRLEKIKAPAEPSESGIKQAIRLASAKEVLRPRVLSMTSAVLALFPVPWIGGIAFHEFGHYIAARLAGVPVHSARLFGMVDSDSVGGFVLHSAAPSAMSAALAALAGPLFELIYMACSAAIAGGLGWAASHSPLFGTTLGVTSGVAAGLFGSSLLLTFAAFFKPRADLDEASRHLNLMRQAKTTDIVYSWFPLAEIDALARSYRTSRQSVVERSLRLLKAVGEYQDNGTIAIVSRGQRVNVIVSDGRRKVPRSRGRARTAVLFFGDGSQTSEFNVWAENLTQLGGLVGSKSKQETIEKSLRLMAAVEPLLEDGTLTIVKQDGGKLALRLR